jgi:hypothetical protein
MASLDRDRFARACPPRATLVSGIPILVDAHTLERLPLQQEAEEYIKEFAARYGRWPSHHRVMRESRVGYGTARRARQAVEAAYLQHTA